MDPPPVRYTTTSDGVSIAWAEAGQGPALLVCPAAPFSHVQGWALVGEWFDALTQSFRVVWFDARGTGMSERDVTCVSDETVLLDAEAVIDAAKLDRFIALGQAGNMLSLSTCLRLATVFPERVTHVVLESPFQNMRELADTPFGRTNRALAELDWSVYTQTFFRVLLGWDAAAMVESYVSAVEGWVEPAVGVQYIREWETVDVGDLLTRVRQPTLVTRKDPYLIPARVSQRVAAKIPGAQFRQYSDPTYAQQAELIRVFVGEPSPPRADVPAATASATAVILFTDIVDSTALTERLGDTVFRTAARALDEGMRAAIRDASGTAIDGKLLGDGVMAVFTSAAQAIDAARRCIELSAESELRLHVGLHAGDVIREAGNVYGGAVNIASRICALSSPGEILVSDIVRGLARTSAGVEFEDRGEQEMKGVAEPVRVYAVRWRNDDSRLIAGPE